ncbi:hypothetical protein X1_46 [Yersinia phage vB_Yen_X1]|nr:hypothetical protein X1_46 [Yersinia phage vB_Yen_X1]
MRKPRDELNAEQIDKMLKVIEAKSDEELSKGFAWVDGRAKHWKEIERLAREIKENFENRLNFMDLTISAIEDGDRERAKGWVCKGYDNLAEAGRLLEEFESKIYD